MYTYVKLTLIVWDDVGILLIVHVSVRLAERHRYLLLDRQIAGSRQQCAALAVGRRRLTMSSHLSGAQLQGGQRHGRNARQYGQQTEEDAER